MMKLMPIFEKFSVVVVPFPFTDQNASKRRSALALSIGCNTVKSVVDHEFGHQLDDLLLDVQVFNS
jgi:hypothetical protein